MLSGVRDHPTADQPVPLVDADMAYVAEDRHRDLSSLALMAV
jgi:hypothetical protein